MVLKHKQGKKRLGKASMQGLIYYHVSNDPNGMWIVSQNDEHAGERGFWCPRISRESYNEEEVPRICIAPTVGQCLIARPGTQPRTCYNIYEVYVKNPEVDRPQKITDWLWTHESWITEGVIKGNGDRIEVRRVGTVSLAPGEIMTLKAYGRGGYFDAYCGQEKIFWGMTGKCWKLWPEVKRPKL